MLIQLLKAYNENENGYCKNSKTKRASQRNYTRGGVPLRDALHHSVKILSYQPLKVNNRAVIWIFLEHITRI